MPTPEQQAAHFNLIGSLAGELEREAEKSNFKEAMLENFFPEPKSMKMVSASDVMEKLKVVEEKIDALTKKIDMIFGGCVLMPDQLTHEGKFVDIKKGFGI